MAEASSKDLIRQQLRGFLCVLERRRILLCGCQFGPWSPLVANEVMGLIDDYIESEFNRDCGNCGSRECSRKVSPCVDCSAKPDVEPFLWTPRG